MNRRDREGGGGGIKNRHALNPISAEEKCVILSAFSSDHCLIVIDLEALAGAQWLSTIIKSKIPSEQFV
jgi:hypothetical protein